MVNGKCNCIVCEKENDYSINTNIKQGEMDDYTLINKNYDGAYLAEIKVKCKYCGAIYKTVDNIKFEPDFISDTPYIYF